MAGSDASIYNLLKPVAPPPDPIQQYGQAMQLRTLMGQQELQGLQTQQARKGIADEEATAAAYRESGGDQKKLLEQLYGRGLYKPAQAVEKNQLETGKLRAETDRARAEVLSKNLQIHRDQLSNVNDPQTAAQWVLSAYQDPVLGPIVSRLGTPEQAVAKIPQDPQAFHQWKMKSGLGIEKMLEFTKPEYKTVGAGGKTVVRQMNPNAPGFSAEPIKHTQSPDSVASVAATIRGQDLVNQRAIKSNEIAEKNAAGQVVTNEGKLRDDVTNASKDFVKVRDAHQRVLASAENPSAAGDLALIFNYMKVLDPGSTVREGEFANAQNSGGINQRVIAMYNNVLRGERLSDDVRKDFVTRSDMLYKSAEQNQAEMERKYEGIAKRGNLNPENVLLRPRVKQDGWKDL